LRNYYNLNYMGDLYLGSQKQKLSVMFDTGSAGLYVTSTGCGSSCGSGSGLYDASKSTTSVAMQGASSIASTEYLDGTSLKGQLVSDTVCPSAIDQSCATGFQFVAITE